jgi:hypothetical protein
VSGHPNQFNRRVNEAVAILNGGAVDGIPLHSVAEDIRAGLEAYENLSFRDIQDGHRQATFIYTTRTLLRRGDGALSRVRSLLGQIQTDLAAWAKSRE